MHLYLQVCLHCSITSCYTNINSLYQGLTRIASDWSNLSWNFIGFETLVLDICCNFWKASKMEGVWNEFTVESSAVCSLNDGANREAGDFKDFGTRCNSESE